MVNKEEEIRKKNLNIVSISLNGVIYAGRSLVRDLYTIIYGMMVTNLIIKLINMPILNMCLNRLKTIINNFYSYANHIIILWSGPKRLQMINSEDFLELER